MFDDFTKERLRTLTIEEFSCALNSLRACLADAREQGVKVAIHGHSWISTVELICGDIPKVLSPETSICIDIPAVNMRYLEIHNPTLADWLVAKGHVAENITALNLNSVITLLRDKADDVAHTHGEPIVSIPWDIRLFLSMFLQPSHKVIEYIDKNVNVEDFIHLLLKDAKRLHPKVHEQYQELRRAKTGDTPLLQAVKQTISHKYFSGSIGSFCPMYLPDIFNSPQFKAMSAHPKHQVILLDMVDLCNFLAGSRKGSNIETNGFRYTWSDCRIEISEDAFRWALKDIVSRGWFKVIGKGKSDDGPAAIMYAPSTDWKKKRLAEKEISRIQKCGEQKRKRIADSKERYRRSKADVECGVEHTFSDI